MTRTMRTRAGVSGLRRRGGFTLLEVMVAAGLLALMVGLALSLFVSSNAKVGESLVINDTVMECNRLKETLTWRLSSAGAFELDGAALSSGGDRFTRLRYRKSGGFDFETGGTLYDTPLRELRFVYDAGEAPLGVDNGVDDDEDGLVDEGSLYLYVDANDDGVIEDSERMARLVTGVSGETFRIEFAQDPRAPSGAGLGNATPSGDDTEVRIKFEIIRRLPELGPKQDDGTREVQVQREAREVHISIRNHT
jgi:prepilin-type N-terminal cleavage/methylation domain-containing protein